MLNLASVTNRLTIINIAILTSKLLKLLKGVFKIIKPFILVPCPVGVTVGHFRNIKLTNHPRMKTVIRLILVTAGFCWCFWHSSYDELKLPTRSQLTKFQIKTWLLKPNDFLQSQKNIPFITTKEKNSEFLSDS